MEAERGRAGIGARLEGVAWGLVVFVIGVLLLPAGPPRVALVAAAGAGLLAVNLARAAMGLPVRSFSTILGGVLAVTAAGAFAGVAVPGDALLVMGLGLALALGQLAGLRHRTSA
jgi:hypothetical protein